MKRLFPVVLLLLLGIGFNSCSKDELIDDDGKRDITEICKDVAEVDFNIMNFYKKCTSISELKQYADEIRTIKGVEEVYFDEPTTMFVRIKDFRTISYSYYPQDEDVTPQMQQMIQRIKAESQGNDTYPHQGFSDAKLLIANHQSDEAGREFTNNFTAAIKSVFNNIEGITVELENKPTIDFFEERAFNCDYLFIITHGCYDNRRNLHWVSTSTKGHRDSSGRVNWTWLEETFSNYPENSVTFSSGDEPIIMFSENFINSLDKQFTHPGSAIVYNTSCSSLKGPGIKDNDTIADGLARAFEKRGAGVYLGYDQTNSFGKVGGVEFFSRLASGMSINSAYQSLSFSVLHDYEKDHDDPTIQFWADLILHPEEGDILHHCINYPIITFEDKSDDSGLNIELFASNIYTKYASATSTKSWVLLADDETKNLPFRYGFELSESENFTNVINTGEKKFGEDGSTGAYLYYTQSLKYNASESNSKIKPETTYWARAYVYDGSGYNYSEPVTFTTKAYSRIDHVIPPDIRDQMDPYITIYDGNNPPNIEGEFIISPSELTYNSVGDYPVGHVFADTYIKFLNQDMHANTLDYREKQASSTQTGEGAFISGEGNNFSVFFNTDGIGHYSDYDISYKTALIISGTKDTNGIHNLQYAFVLVDKSDDPKPYIISVGDFRVIKDGDGYSPATTWASFMRKMKQSNQQHKPSFLEWKKR